MKSELPNLPTSRDSLVGRSPGWQFDFNLPDLRHGRTFRLQCLPIDADRLFRAGREFLHRLPGDQDRRQFRDLPAIAGFVPFDDKRIPAGHNDFP